MGHLFLQRFPPIEDRLTTLSSRELICPPVARYRWAQFQVLLPGGTALFELDHAECNSRVVHVDPADVQGNHFKPNQRVEVFLVHQTKSLNWLSKIWRREDNPWLNGALPKIGDDVTATVTRFLHSRDAPQRAWLAIANIPVGGGTVEADVPKEHLPEDAESISDILKIGDKLRASIHDIEPDQLRIRLNVNTWLARSRTAAERYNAEARFTKETYRRAPAPPPSVDAPLEERRILVIDNDSRLRTSVSRWLQSYGAETWALDGTSGLSSAIDKFAPTHALVDYRLEDPRDPRAFDRVASELKQFGGPVAIFTGTPNRALNAADRFEFGLIGKPANIQDILEWIAAAEPHKIRPDLPKTDRKRSAHWSVEASTDSIIQEANDLLDRLCSRYGCRAAFWVVQERDEVFELRAASGSLVAAPSLATAISELSRSIVEQSRALDQVIHGRLPKNDPLQPCAAALHLTNPHYLALPIIKDAVRPRIVLFLNEGEITADIRERIEARRDHFELLIRAVQQAEHVDHVEAFATQGRLASASVHEAKNILQLIAQSQRAIDIALDEHDIAKARAAAHELGGDIRSLQRIVTQGLEIVRAERRAITNIDNVVRRIVATMQTVAVSYHKNELAMVNFEASNRRLVTAIPPAPLEQALINLIDNALGFLPEESWAMVKVRAGIDITDEKTPIHIDVIDNGPGLDADQRSRLFEARKTARGARGNGLGLFVSRNIVRAAGGDLLLADTVRWGGAHFQIRLPAIFAAMDDV